MLTVTAAQHGCERLSSCVGVTGLLAAKEVPLLLRLSVAHRQDGLVPGVSAAAL